MRWRFPAERLPAQSGVIHAIVFENANVGIPPTLFWSCMLRFGPVVYEGEEWNCSMAAEWIPWRLRDGRQLPELKLHCSYGDEGVGASFHLVEHDYASTVEASFRSAGGAMFELSMRMSVEFTGYTGEDAAPPFPSRAAPSSPSPASPSPTSPPPAPAPPRKPPRSPPSTSTSPCTRSRGAGRAGGCCGRGSSGRG